ncbi:MAG: excinuclease ABC subunit UvrC [Cyclobacteriaceae bacterium]|nr:excinuclease ABC subunit UvrC [Cyclobacteriaceae bacterium]
MNVLRYDKNQIHELPDLPGVYKFFKQDGKIIYVGKAKSLKKRVSSYFQKSTQHNRKTLRLIGEIAFIEITLVNSEFDALLLENNLIKENQPKYNILLKDDKTFPSIVITNEPFPRIFSTRNRQLNTGEYFGPFSSIRAMNHILELVTKLYKVRNCSLSLTPSNIRKKKFKVCLEYHVGNCLGPCVGLQTEADYLQDIFSAKNIIKGNIQPVKQFFQNRMNEAAGKLEFETAQVYKVKLEYLTKFQSKTTIVTPTITNVDVLTILWSETHSFLNYMKIEDGCIIASETMEVRTHMGESIDDIFNYTLPIIQFKYQSTNTVVLSNKEAVLQENMEVIVPQIGDKRKLVDLSLKNALHFKHEKLKTKLKKQDSGERILAQLQEDLRLKTLPIHIECFDNSNIQGTNPVASMVCFKNARPSKKDYRKFSIKTVVGPDDFSSMQEIVYRRYSRILNEKTGLPDLIVIDGGKGQLSAAIHALKNLDLYGKVPIVGIAKRLEEIYFPNDELPLFISKKSESLKLIQRIRDEAHRFAITFHRNKRSKNSIVSELDEIKGIGPKSKTLLLAHYKSSKRIKELDLHSLSALLGKAKAQMVWDHFNKKGA